VNYISNSTRFSAVRSLAHGAISRVYLAHDLELDRVVALKELRRRYAADPRMRARIRFEAAITAGLEHPGVVPVYGLGEHADGRTYFTMRRIRGGNLSDAIARAHRIEDRRERNRLRRKLLDRLVDVCYTMAHAHTQAIVHRDLNPTNIMLGQSGETLVIDWGFARRIEVSDRAPENDLQDDQAPHPDWPACTRDVLATRLGRAIGTVGYMSPEQASGHSDRHGTAVDVYSLGAILYTILTGRPSISEHTHVPFDETLERIRHGGFRDPHTIAPAIDRDLEAICLKAMKPDPADRHTSPLHLGDAITQWLEENPVSPCPRIPVGEPQFP
jgi:serine/threonine protein kinase